MKTIFKIQLILFTFYMCSYTLIDHYCFNQDIKWTTNLILALIFSVVISLIITNEK